MSEKILFSFELDDEWSYTNHIYEILKITNVII